MDKYSCGGVYMVKTKISMTIDSDIYNNFKSYCQKNGMKVSSKAELLMKEAVKNTGLNQFINP